MKQVLVVDDKRIFLSYEDVHNAEITYARNTGQALTALLSPVRFEQIFLDHDLGGDDDATAIAKLLALFAVIGFLRDVEVFVCSDNGPGIENLIGILKPQYPNVRHFQPAYIVREDN